MPDEMHVGGSEPYTVWHWQDDFCRKNFMKGMEKIESDVERKNDEPGSDHNSKITDFLHRIFSSQTITPFELRLAGLLALEWWLMDHLWFIGTVMGWW